MQERHPNVGGKVALPPSEILTAPRGREAESTPGHDVGLRCQQPQPSPGSMAVTSVNGLLSLIGRGVGANQHAQGRGAKGTWGKEAPAGAPLCKFCHFLLNVSQPG